MAANASCPIFGYSRHFFLLLKMIVKKQNKQTRQQKHGVFREFVVSEFVEGR